MEQLLGLPAKHIFEIGTSYGIVTALLDNAGYEVKTMDLVEPRFKKPAVENIRKDIRETTVTDIPENTDAIFSFQQCEMAHMFGTL